MMDHEKVSLARTLTAAVPNDTPDTSMDGIVLACAFLGLVLVLGAVALGLAS